MDPITRTKLLFFSLIPLIELLNMILVLTQCSTVLNLNEMKYLTVGLSTSQKTLFYYDDK